MLLLVAPSDLSAATEFAKQTIESSSEQTLKSFVDWCLTRSYSKEYSPVQALQLLELAWQAQRQIWRLRKQQNVVPDHSCSECTP